MRKVVAVGEGGGVEGDVVLPSVKPQIEGTCASPRPGLLGLTSITDGERRIASS
ncbi:MAG: hypothetical protein ACRYG8_15535 [Janthinobacterium lividum]